MNAQKWSHHPRVSMQAVTIFSTQGNRPGLENHVLVDEDKGIFVLSDGLGGPGPGFEAAKISCEAVKGFLFKEAGDQDATFPFELRSYFSLAGNVLFNSLLHANQKVLSFNRGKSVHEKGGASVLAGYIDEGLLALANVGNCTAWLIREGRSIELVIPRSYGRLVNSFRADIPLDERVPLMTLGMSRDLEPEICEFRVYPGDWIFMHTEGLPSGLHEQIFDVQRAQGGEGGLVGDITQWASQRVFELLNHGSFDSDLTASLIIL